MKLPVIFIVEDSKVILELLTYTLQKQVKAHFVTYESAEDAIRGLDVYRPDVILLDYNLDSTTKSNMHGLSFLKKLEEYGIQCPSIVMSNQRIRTTTVELLKHGAVSYVSKEKDDFIDALLDELKLILQILRERREIGRNERNLRRFIWPFILLIIIPIIVTCILLFT